MSRILNRQRQLAEQGRLRLGYTVPGKTKAGKDIDRPVRSETWIVTSHSREHVEHAATLWGGDVAEWQPMGNGARQWRVITTSSSIPALLPPGDPLSQAYEQWNRGGCVRRCDGVTEQFSGSPCICLAQHGDTWFELGPKDVCSSKSRLKVILQDMPGLGVWRMETGSFYATDEIAGMVDTIRAAVGDAPLIPVTLRIEPRTRVAGGETKQFVVPVVELRGVSAGALLSGQAIDRRMLAAGNPDSTTPLALQAADPYEVWFGVVEAAESLEDLSSAWTEMVAAQLVGVQSAASQRRAEFITAWQERARALKNGEPKADADGAYEAEIVPDDGEDPASRGVDGDGGEASGPNAGLPADPDADADVVWQRVLAVGGTLGMGLADLSDDFSRRMQGVLVNDATAEQLNEYLTKLQEGNAA